MELAFPWPASQGEWLAWTSAAITVVLGLLLLFAPRLSFRVMRLETAAGHPEAVAEARSTMAGFHLGLGLCAILFQQDFTWLALGVCWAFTAFGRLISMMSDRGNTLYNWISLLVEIVLAALPLVYVFGMAP